MGQLKFVVVAIYMAAQLGFSFFLFSSFSSIHNTQVLDSSIACNTDKKAKNYLENPFLSSPKLSRFSRILRVFAALRPARRNCIPAWMLVPLSK